MGDSGEGPQQELRSRPSASSKQVRISTSLSVPQGASSQVTRQPLRDPSGVPVPRVRVRESDFSTSTLGSVQNADDEGSAAAAGAAVPPAAPTPSKRGWFGRRHKGPTTASEDGDGRGSPSTPTTPMSSHGSSGDLIATMKSLTGDNLAGTSSRTHVFYRIVFLEGRNLVPADNVEKRKETKEPSSDPYVVFRLCDSHGAPISKANIRTQVVGQTLTPYWGEEHIIPIPKGIDVGEHGPLLEIGVFDADGTFKKDDYLGGYILSLQHRDSNDPTMYPWLMDQNGQPTFNWPTGRGSPGTARKRRLSKASEAALAEAAHSHETLQDVTKVVVKLGLYPYCDGGTKCKLPDHVTKSGHPMFPLSQLGTTKTVEKAYKQRNGDIGEIVLKLQRIPDDDVVTPADEEAWARSTRLISLTLIECRDVYPRNVAILEKIASGRSMQVLCKVKIGKPGSELERKTATAKVRRSTGLSAQFREAHEFYVKGM